MKDKINTFKDYILKLAYEGKSIDYSGMSRDDKAVWQHYVKEVINAGYATDLGVIGASWLEITPSGIVFLLDGGFSGDRQKTSIDIGKYFDMFIEVLIKEGLSILVRGVLKY